MVLVSRPPDVPTPSPTQTLDEDLLDFLQRPYEDDAAAGGHPPIATLTLNSPQTKDRLLAYAYAVYDTFVTRQLPTRSIPPDHAALLLPLLELLHGLYSYDSPVALLLGCVYHHHDLPQRSLQINRHILQYDPNNVSAMCNLGANLCLMGLPAQAFEYWWRALQLSPINWDILDNMVETFLGPKDFNGTSLTAPDDSNMLHILQIRRQALRVCNFVVGRLPENPVKMEEVHRAQNSFRLRALLLRSLQEPGEWADLVDGIEIGINTSPTPHSLPAGPGRPTKTTFDDLLLRVHCIGTSICDSTVIDASSGDGFLNPPGDIPSTAAVVREGPDASRSLGASGREIPQPTLLLFPQEVLQLPLMLWPSTHGSLPSVTVPTTPGNSYDDIRMEWLKASTKATTGKLLRTWAATVQDFLETQPSTSRDHPTLTTIPGSMFQATQSLVVLAGYLALSLSPTAASYNDLGIFLSSLDSQPRVSRSPRSRSPSETPGHNLSRVYFEAGLAVDPNSAHLLTNLGSYWKKEGNYEEAIRYYRLALANDLDFTAAREHLEWTLREIKPDFEGVRDEPTYQKFD